MKVALIIAILLFVAWNVWGYFSSNVEQAAYEVVTKGDGYEIRRYAPHIVAQTSVSGNYDEALNEGFRIVATYIFGANTSREKVAMTAPVTAQKGANETIAMTAPVTSSREGSARTIAFVMPKGYTLETLPTPNDSRVRFVEVPEKDMAVIRFSWYRNSARVQAMEEKLLSMLQRDGVTVLGTPIYAGYNAPWTPPWLVRNEVMIEVGK
jgi:hypothetical protein